jgi:4,5-DOPA dioxygenase extradiol
MAESYAWAIRFETKARELLLAGDVNGLIDYQQLGRDALLSIPTPDHYLPLLYVIGAWRQSDQNSFPVEGIDCGTVSMLAVQAGR